MAFRPLLLEDGVTPLLLEDGATALLLEDSDAPRSVSGADPEPWQWQTKKKKRTTQERKAVKDDLRETLQEIIQGPAPVVVQVEAKELLVHVEESPKATPAQEQRVERLVLAVQEYTRQRRRRQEEELLLMD